MLRLSVLISWSFCIKKKEKFNNKKVKIQRIWRNILCLLPKLQDCVKNKKTIVIKKYLKYSFLEEKKKAKG